MLPRHERRVAVQPRLRQQGSQAHTLRLAGLIPRKTKGLPPVLRFVEAAGGVLRVFQGSPMPRTRSRKSGSSSTLVPRVKVWLELDGSYAFGLGICEILLAVEETGSIKHAAGALGKSYRHVWSRIKEAEQALGDKLVEAHVGGGDDRRSFLTERARQLTASFTALRARLIRVAEEEFARQFAS
jgi:molybdate transport system regulatory protein